MRMLDVDLASGFHCSQCEGDDGLSPEIIICDGTSVSFQRRMWSWDSEEDDQEYMDLTPSRFADRVFVEDPHVRKLLLRYASDDRSKRRTGYLRDLSNSEKANMFDYFKEVLPPFYQLLIEIEDNPTIMRPVFQRLLLCLASPSPVCSLIPPTEDIGTLFANIYKEIDIQQDPTLWNTLHNKLPVFFEIIQALPSGCQLLRPLLKELWSIAADPFCDALAQNKQLPPLKNTEMSFFPHLPALQSRGKYIADKSSEKRTKAYSQRCRKKNPGHPTLLPGVFTIFCPHGVCYGFQVMPNNESPNVPFTILRTRFKKAPKCVIYDNACKLHAYCISRDPLFFKDTVFYVDRLHWDNHKGCSLAYDLSLYPMYTHINSQCNEQANAGLQRIKDQLSYMTADNFMFHCSLYLWNKNIIKLQGLAKVIQ
ncbi:hypothetical protein FSP39_021641 [Pinctada imbricata]|uniref:Uncharacterized protein n=1 Tax=Pinctada imbricata TaxID=66713 RepID=A0AA88YNP3_PINIB|nr:hypothetical protein FSP39_021641 [Pinctada imbricata]